MGKGVETSEDRSVEELLERLEESIRQAAEGKTVSWREVETDF